MTSRDIFESGAYCICYDCGSTVKERAEARWLINRDNWDHMVCTECAGKYPPDSTKEISQPPDMATVIEQDTLVDRHEAKVKEHKKLRKEAILRVLVSEGYKVGMRIWLRNKEFEVTGCGSNGMFSRGEQYISVYPVTKKGVASKIGVQHLVWYDFIKLWRRQRADELSYRSRCKVQDDELQAKAQARREERAKGRSR